MSPSGWLGRLSRRPNSISRREIGYRSDPRDISMTAAGSKWLWHMLSDPISGSTTRWMNTWTPSDKPPVVFPYADLPSSTAGDYDKWRNSQRSKFRECFWLGGGSKAVADRLMTNSFNPTCTGWEQRAILRQLRLAFARRLRIWNQAERGTAGGLAIRWRHWTNRFGGRLLPLASNCIHCLTCKCFGFATGSRRIAAERLLLFQPMAVFPDCAFNNVCSIGQMQFK